MVVSSAGSYFGDCALDARFLQIETRQRAAPVFEFARLGIHREQPKLELCPVKDAKLYSLSTNKLHDACGGLIGVLPGALCKGSVPIG